MVDGQRRAHKVTLRIPMSQAKLRNLAAATCDWRLMAINAGTCVVGWSQAFVYAVSCFKRDLVAGENIGSGESVSRTVRTWTFGVSWSLVSSWCLRLRGCGTDNQHT